MSDFLSGAMVGLIVGWLLAVGGLIAMGATPKDMQQKLCSEAEWKLPSCVERIEKAIEEVKGTKHD